MSDEISPATARPALLWQAHLNALLWGLGNGLVSTTLATYLARQLGAEGLAVSFIVASANLAGGLRLFTPWILNWVGSRKWFAVAMFILSAGLLLALPVLCEPGYPSDRLWKLQLLVVLWGGWHLAMFVAMIAVWSWLADLVASKSRGTFIGIRTSWLKAGEIGGILLAAGFSFWYPQVDPAIAKWQTYAWPALAGAFCMVLAVLPVVWMPDVKISAPSRPSGQLWNALTDRRFWPLLGFWSYAGFVNGVSQSAQGLYPFALKLPLATTLSMVAAMSIGQILLGPGIGWLADRRGSRTIMIVSQVLVSLALVFFPLAIPATKTEPAFAYGMWIAYGLFIAYAGLNVCLPHVMLKLSPGENSPPYISTYFALGGLTMAVSTVLFGWVFDQIPREFQLSLAGWSVDRFQLFLYLGAVLRLSSVAWLCWLPQDAVACDKMEELKPLPTLATR